MPAVAATALVGVGGPVGLAGFAGFAAANPVAGALTDGYRPTAEAISALAALDAGAPAVMIAVFVALAVGLLSAGPALRTRLEGRAGTVGGVPVVVAGVLTVPIGLARQDCSTLTDACAAREVAGTVSGAHVTHNLLSLLMLLVLVAGLFLIARGVRRTPQLRHLTLRRGSVPSPRRPAWSGSSPVPTGISAAWSSAGSCSRPPAPRSRSPLTPFGGDDARRREPAARRPRHRPGVVRRWIGDR